MVAAPESVTQNLRAATGSAHIPPIFAGTALAAPASPEFAIAPDGITPDARSLVVAFVQKSEEYCWSSLNYDETCCGKSCNAAMAITNGVSSPCTSSLVSDTYCYPTCNSGYTRSGYRYCSQLGASLTSTAACNPNPCTIPAPTNGALGACPSSLESGRSCTPSCNTGYVQTAGGTYSCSLGVISGTVTCTATPRCAPYNKRTLWPGERVWELSGFTP